MSDPCVRREVGDFAGALEHWNNEKGCMVNVSQGDDVFGSTRTMQRSTLNLPRAFTTSASSSRAWASNQFFMTSVPQAMEKVSSDTALNLRYTRLMCLCMFHCAGVWDGLGGTLKEWLWKRIVSLLAWDPSRMRLDNKSCRCIRGGDAAGPDERARGSGCLPNRTLTTRKKYG